MFVTPEMCRIVVQTYVILTRSSSLGSEISENLSSVLFRQAFATASGHDALLEKGRNKKSPFVKGDLEGFSSAEHHFDDSLPT